MKRFWVFPFTLAIVGTFLPSIVLIEGTLPFLFTPCESFGNTPLGGLLNWAFRNPTESLKTTIPYGAVAGAIFGTIVGTFDWFYNTCRNSPRMQKAPRLALNVCWCLFYGEFIYLFLLTGFIVSQFILWPHAKWRFVLSFPVFVSSVIRLGGVFWASVRSVTENTGFRPTYQ